MCHVFDGDLVQQVGGAFLQIKMSSVQCGDNCHEYMMVILMMIYSRKPPRGVGGTTLQIKMSMCGDNFHDMHDDGVFDDAFDDVFDEVFDNVFHGFDDNFVQEV